jgi:hypothetical protein
MTSFETAYGIVLTIPGPGMDMLTLHLSQGSLMQPKS